MHGVGVVDISPGQIDGIVDPVGVEFSTVFLDGFAHSLHFLLEYQSIYHFIRIVLYQTIFYILFLI